MATTITSPTDPKPPKRGEWPDPVPDDGDELDEKLADAEQVQQLADWIGAHKDELQEKFDNMSEGAQEGDRGQAVQEKIEALESAESSIGDEMIEEDLQNVIGELEGSGIRVPRLKGGKSKKTSKVPDNADGEVPARPSEKGRITPKADDIQVSAPDLPEPQNAKERREKERFFLLIKVIDDGMATHLEVCLAFKEIYDTGCWKWGGFKNYPHFIKVRYGLGRASGYQYRQAGRVYTILKSAKADLPKNPNQLKPLLSLKDPKQIVTVWSAAHKQSRDTKYGVTEDVVASAKRQILHIGRKLPPITADQLADQFVKQFRPKWDRCLEGEHGKLLGNLLVVLKVFYEELNMDERSPRLTEIFKDIDIVEPEQPAKATVEVHPAPKQEQDKGKPANGSNGHHGFDWDQVNWELRNPDIATIWRKKYRTVIQRRFRNKYGPAVECDPEHYQQKLETEKAKAKALGQSQTTDGTQPIPATHQ
jgi:hypothetical protein